MWGAGHQWGAGQPQPGYPAPPSQPYLHHNNQQQYQQPPYPQQQSYQQQAQWQPQQAGWHQHGFAGGPPLHPYQAQYAPPMPAGQPAGWQASAATAPPLPPAAAPPATLQAPHDSQAQPPLPEGPPPPLPMGNPPATSPPLPPGPQLSQAAQQPPLPPGQPPQPHPSWPGQQHQQHQPHMYTPPFQAPQPIHQQQMQQGGLQGYQQQAYSQYAQPQQHAPPQYAQPQQHAPPQYSQPQQHLPPQYAQPQQPRSANGFGWSHIPSQQQQQQQQQQQPPQAGPQQPPLLRPPLHTASASAAVAAPTVAPGATSQQPTARVPAAAPPPVQPTVDALSLLQPGAARERRPKRLAVLLRGLPGSGKSRVARLMREREVAAGGDPPRILSLDDYFMTEDDEDDEGCGEEGGGGTRRGRKRKGEEGGLVYRHEAGMEAAYRCSLLKAFQRTAAEGRHRFIVVDSPAIKVADFKDFWSAGQAAGYEVYVAQPPETDPQVCFARCVHGRGRDEILRLAAEWEPTPPLYTLLLLDGLLERGCAAASDIAEVEMGEEGEEAGEAAKGQPTGSAEDDHGAGGDEEGSPGARPTPASRWAALDDSSEEGEERGAGSARARKKARGSGGDGGLAVDDWRELLPSWKPAAAATGGTPRSILSKGSGGSAQRKRVRWPDEEAAGRSSDQTAEEEPAFRIGGAAAGAPAKAGLEVVHLLHGLGPPAELEDGTPGVAPHPGSTPQRGRGGFAAAARAEHQTEADLFRRLLLSRTGGGA